MLKFYHAPWSRSSSVLWLLEELQAPYDLELVDMHAQGGVPESYRAIQPSKKVPAIVHDGHIVTERAAITLYLADMFPEAGLAPAIDDPARAAYLRSLVYHDAVFDPVVCARVHGLAYENALPERPVFKEYVARIEQRPAYRKAQQIDMELASRIPFFSGENAPGNV